MSTCSVQLDKLRAAFLATAFAIAAVLSLAIAQPAYAADSVDVWERLQGPFALDTMQNIVDEGWGDQQNGAVVLTTFNGYWDALAASGIAGRLDAPVLMTYPDVLSPQTKSIIEKLKPTRIVVCGGYEAMPDAVVDEAKAAAGGTVEVTRLWGNNARGTAISIFKETADLGGSWTTTAFVATSFSFHDALAAAPIAYAKNMPVFMTRCDNGAVDGIAQDELEADTLAAMKTGGITDIVICGGNAAVSPTVEATLVKEFGEDHVSRYWGATAVETSQALAQYGIEKQGMSANDMGVATVNDYYDALAGAALCGLKNSVLTLVGAPDNSVITGFIPSQYSGIDHGYVFGGPVAVSEEIENALKAIDLPNYFDVNLQKGAEKTGKSFSKNEFNALKSDSTAPMSSTMNAKGGMNIDTAATYVTLEDLFAAAGSDYAAVWSAGAGAVSYAASDGFSGSADIATLKAGKFFPDDVAANATAVIPCLSLTEMATAVGGDFATAGAAQANNVATANTKNSPRIVYGITDEQFSAKDYPAGKNFVSNVVNVTLKDAEASQLAEVTFVTNGGTEVAPQMVKKGEYVDTSKIETTNGDLEFAGWYQKKDFSGDALDLATYAITADVTFYAKWDEPKTYLTVELLKGDGTSSSVGFTQKQFEALKSDSTAPMSTTMNAKGGMSIDTAATYVTLEDLFTAAGSEYAAIWASGEGAVGYAASDGFSGSADIATLKAGKFFPDDVAANATAVIPCLSLTEMATAVGGDFATAGAAQANNVEKANANNSPRIVYGITDAQFAAQDYPGGKNFVSNIVKVTLKDKDAASKALVSFETDGGTAVEPQLIAKGGTLDASAVTTNKEGFVFDGWYQKKDLSGDPYDLATATFNADTTLYAKWSEAVTTANSLTAA